MAETLDVRKEGICEVWDVKSYRAALRAEAAEIRESLARIRGEDQDVYSYTDDPDVSEHDRDLQGALDYNMINYFRS